MTVGEEDKLDDAEDPKKDEINGERSTLHHDALCQEGKHKKEMKDEVQAKDKPIQPGGQIAAYWRER